MRFTHLLLVLAGLTAAMPLLHAQREKLSPEDLAIVEQRWPNAKKTSTGLRYLVLTPSASTEIPKPGAIVSVLYKGMLLDDTVFDAAIDPARPFRFRVGRSQVIEGWDQALQQMKKGEKCLWIIPYEYAYGTRGHPPGIPRCATLIFEIELLDIEQAK